MPSQDESSDDTSPLKRFRSLETRRSFMKKAGVGTAAAAAMYVAPQFSTAMAQRAYAKITGPGNVRRCVVLFDEDTIDNDMYSLLAAWPSITEIADQQGTVDGFPELDVTADILVNENNPISPVSNPWGAGVLPPLSQERWLEWNRTYADDPNYVLLPGGQVDDEGVFVLRDATPEFLKNFMEGNTNPSDVNPINVCALRNDSLRELIGADCIGVVYDDDINVQSDRQDDLRKEISGLFHFRVRGVLRPGNGTLDPDTGVFTGGVHSEASSSSSLLSLWVEVLPCVDDFTNLFSPLSSDGAEPPDTVAISAMGFKNGNIVIVAESNHASSGAQLNVSIGPTNELENQSVWPISMVPDSGNNYRAIIPAAVTTDLVGNVVLISSSHGGSNVDYGRVFGTV